ncbi:hypothetical protein [Pseudalkalibacillus berkeleyi]|uniref:Uncharacterized protein n=1 Tax=Pseudalkalibacillus berkeleyi TaxID=1069813 RepID=A0ABS9H5H1_9BACL|nr:hypothetical protein [Pseudalkalibacillus berkeleyi]MCF6139215.1 hypothetical protein [Pseudalkalibacillus berkeleyi]
MGFWNRNERVRAVIDQAVESAMENIKEGSDASAAVVQEDDIIAAVSVAIGDDLSASASAAVADEDIIPAYAMNVRTITAPPSL